MPPIGTSELAGSKKSRTDPQARPARRLSNRKKSVAFVIPSAVLLILRIADRGTSRGSHARADQRTFSGTAGLVTNDGTCGGTAQGSDNGTALGIRAGGTGTVAEKPGGRQGKKCKGFVHGVRIKLRGKSLPDRDFRKAECILTRPDARSGEFIHPLMPSSAAAHSFTSRGPWKMKAE